MDVAATKVLEAGEPCAQMTELNKFHLALQEMVRDAILAMNSSASRETIEAMLKKIVDCSKNHILDEGRIVRETSCGRCLPRNSREQKFFDATMELVCRVKAGGRLEALELLEHLEDWLMDHVSKKHRLCSKLDRVA